MAIRKATIRAAVLDQLQDGEWHYCLDLMRGARTRAGFFYPVIQDMESEDRVIGRFEAGPYPRRRLYHLGPNGVDVRGVCPRCGAGWKDVVMQPGDPRFRCLACGDEWSGMYTSRSR